MIYLTALGWHPVAVVQYTFTNKQYIEQHNRQKPYIEQHNYAVGYTHVWKLCPKTNIFLSLCFVIPPQICHWLTWALLELSPRPTHVFTCITLLWKLLIMTIYSHAIQPTVGATHSSETLLTQIDHYVIGDCNIMWSVIVISCIIIQVALFSTGVPISP